LSRLYWALPVALPLLLGCAAGSAASGPRAPSPADARTIIVQVNNNLTPRSVVTVRVEAVSGARVTLGSVPPGGIRQLRLKETVFTTAFQLVALRADGSTVTSRAFQLSPRALVIWSLRTNALEVTEQKE
jgi:hypothetical protein